MTSKRKRKSERRAPPTQLRLKPGQAKRERFVAEYLVDQNATQAAMRAGYSPKTSYAQGARLLKDAVIAAAVRAGLAKLAKAAGITQERVVAELELLAFSDAVTHYLADQHGNVTLAPGAPAGALRAIQSIRRRFTTTGSGDTERTMCEVEIKLWDKPGMLKLAGRHVDVHGFAERVELTGKNGGPLETRELTKAEVAARAAALAERVRARKC